MQDLSGRKLGNYELRERLGRGGMAEVYKAYQGGMDRFVAIKVMLGHLASDESFIERFKREAQAVGRLRHPHIVQIFDFGIENDVYYMAMEFIQGRTLKDYINQHKRLPVQEALHIMRQLADGLDYAHKAGMIHRDLKPANVMFINEEKQEVVLTDFGIARIMGASGLTGTGMAVGTPAYMSPEAGRGETTDERADIYALGIMLYEMVTGQTPYDADTPLAVIMKHINAPLPTRKDFGDIIPENVEALIMKCLAKDPEDRYKTAGDFRDALDVAIKDVRHTASTKPVELSHDDKPTMMAKSAGDDKVTEAVEKAKVMPSPKAKAGGNNTGMMVAAAVVVLLLLGFGAFQIFGAQNNEPSEVAQDATDVPDATDAPDEVLATDAPDVITGTDAPVGTNPEATASGDYPLSFGGTLPPHPDNLNLYTGISPLMDEIDAMLLEGRWDDAIAYLDGILEADPTNFSALFARAEYYSLRYDDTQQDLADANALIESAPDSEWGYVALFDANNNHPEQNTDAARAAIEQAYEMAPTNPHVLWRRAAYSSYEVQTERYDEAEAAGARGYRYMAWRGDYLFNDLDFERAIPYQEMIYRYGIPESYDRTDVSFWGLISSLILLDRSTEAFSVFMESGLMDEADDFRLYADAAYLAFRAGEYEQARNWAATSTALSGEAYAAQYVQALLMGYVDGNPDGAVALLTSLGETELYTRFINWEFQEDINLRSARILGEANRFEDALVYYNLVIEYYSYEAWLYEERADAYLELGDVNAARSDLQTAVDIVQDSGYRRDLLERLTALGPAPTSTPEPSETPEPEATDE